MKCPGLSPDSPETLYRSLEQLLKVREAVPPFAVKFHRAVPFPGTIFYSDAVSGGLIGKEHGKYLSELTVGEAIIGTRYLTQQGVTDWIGHFLREFLTPGYLLKSMEDKREGLAFEMKRVAQSSGLVKV